jgi:hypothetical protein
MVITSFLFFACRVRKLEVPVKSSVTKLVHQTGLEPASPGFQDRAFSPESVLPEP